MKSGVAHHDPQAMSRALSMRPEVAVAIGRCSDVLPSTEELTRQQLEVAERRLRVSGMKPVWNRGISLCVTGAHPVKVRHV